MKISSLLHSMALVSVASGAFANTVEIRFQGAVDQLNFGQNVYDQVEHQYAPVDFLNATSFSGILSYDDDATLDYQGPGNTNIYKSSIQFTVAGSYTMQSAGVVYVSNDYGGWWDSISFYFNDFPTPFITPDNEMEPGDPDTWLGISFYDHSASIFNNSNLPSANSYPSINAFDYLPLELTIASSANTIYIPCDGPPCTGEPMLFDPIQRIGLQGHITGYTVSEVPLPSSGAMLAPALLLLLKRKRRARC